MVCYRKRINLGKGFGINISKSGLSFSMGIPGFRITMGSKGTYVHSSIPGTGIYSRKKISGYSSPKSNRHVEHNAHYYAAKQMEALDRSRRRMEREHRRFEKDMEKLHRELDQINAELKAMEIGAENERITTLHCLGRSTYAYSDVVALRNEILQDKDNDESLRFHNVKKPSFEEARMLVLDTIKEEYSTFEEKQKIQELYKEKEQLVPPTKPMEQEVYDFLFEGAMNTADTIWPWKKKSIAERYAKEHVGEVLSQRMAEWEPLQKEYSDKLYTIEAQINSVSEAIKIKQAGEADDLSNIEQLTQSAIDNWKEDRIRYLEECYDNLTDWLEGNDDFVVSRIETVLQEMSFPFDFSVEYEYDAEQKQISVEINLPSIDVVPLEKAYTTNSGTEKSKQKTQKEINHDYLSCICGFSLYVASAMFNISSVIKRVRTLGFDEIIDSRIGTLTKQYLFAVSFDRESFSNIKLTRDLDPIEAFTVFPSIININKRTYSFDAIDASLLSEAESSFFKPNFDLINTNNPIDYEKLFCLIFGIERTTEGLRKENDLVNVIINNDCDDSNSSQKLDSSVRMVAELVVSTQNGSTSHIQRTLNLGYNRAGQIMDQLERLGIVGPLQLSNHREILVNDLGCLDKILKKYNL